MVETFKRWEPQLMSFLDLWELAPVGAQESFAQAEQGCSAIRVPGAALHIQRGVAPFRAVLVSHSCRDSQKTPKIVEALSFLLSRAFVL